MGPLLVCSSDYGARSSEQSSSCMFRAKMAIRWFPRRRFTLWSKRRACAGRRPVWVTRREASEGWGQSWMTGNHRRRGNTGGRWRKKLQTGFKGIGEDREIRENHHMLVCWSSLTNSWLFVNVLQTVKNKQVSRSSFRKDLLENGFINLPLLKLPVDQWWFVMEY